MSSNGKLSTETDRCKFSNASIIIAGLLIMGMLTLCIEFTKNFISNGIVISTLIILVSLIYFCVLLIQDLYKHKGDVKNYMFVYILLFINFIINSLSISYFIYMFSSTKTIEKINKKDVLSTLSKSVNGFLFVLFIYIFINYYIYSRIRCVSTNDIPVIINWLVFFAFCECIVEILLLIMINTKLRNITDG
jgi:hypothetical protein